MQYGSCNSHVCLRITRSAASTIRLFTQWVRMCEQGSRLFCTRLFLAASVAAASVVATSGCTTTGHTFDARGLDLFVPGQTTLAQASALLKAEPTHVYRQADGAATARWAHHTSFVPDAIYFNRELWLYFDAHGYFQRVVNSINVPQSHHAL